MNTHRVVHHFLLNEHKPSVCHQVVLACMLDHWKSRPAAAASHGLQLLKHSDGLSVFLVAEVGVFWGYWLQQKCRGLSESEWGKLLFVFPPP